MNLCHAPLAVPVQTANARMQAQEQAQHDAEIRAAFGIGLALVLADS